MLTNTIELPGADVKELFCQLERPELEKKENRSNKREEARQQKLTQAMARLGVGPLPQHYTVFLSLSQIEIEGPVSKEEERSATRLATNLQALGALLQPPVVEENYDRYRVLAGRRRILAARLAGLEQVECRVYPPLSPEQRRSLALSENFARSPNRRVELAGICRLVRENEAVTEKELCAIFGLSPGTARRYLQIALLPGPLVEEAVAGNLSLELAGQISRLSKEQQGGLAGLVEAGEEVTGEQVHNLRYARASHNLNQLAANFEEVDELAGQLLAGNDSAPPQGVPLEECLGESETPGYYREVLVRLKRFMAARCPGRSAHQAGLYVEAILAELGGIL